MEIQNVLNEEENILKARLSSETWRAVAETVVQGASSRCRTFIPLLIYYTTGCTPPALCLGREIIWFCFQICQLNVNIYFTDMWFWNTALIATLRYVVRLLCLQLIYTKKLMKEKCLYKISSAETLCCSMCAKIHSRPLSLNYRSHRLNSLIFAQSISIFATLLSSSLLIVISTPWMTAWNWKIQLVYQDAGWNFFGNQAKK